MAAALPPELLRLVCLELSPAPCQPLAPLQLSSQQAEPYDDVRALLAVAACSKALQSIALTEPVWQRHLRGTWLFGHLEWTSGQGVGGADSAFQEYRRRAIKDTEVRKLVREFAHSTGEPFPFYARLDELAGDAPEELWEELRRTINTDHPAIRPPDFLGLAHAANLCWQHLAELQALSTWHKIGMRWNSASFKPHASIFTNEERAPIMRMPEKDFRYIPAMVEEAYSAFSLFDSEVDPSGFRVLQLMLDEAVRDVLSRDDTPLAELARNGSELREQDHLRRGVELVHRVLHCEMGFRLEAEDGTGPESEVEDIMIGHLGARLWNGDKELLYVSKKQLALLFVFVCRRLPEHLRFRCLHLGRELESRAYVIISDGQDGEIFCCCVDPWTNSPPAILSTSEAQQNRDFRGLPPESAFLPLSTVGTICLEGTDLVRVANDLVLDDDDQDQSIVLAGSIALAAMFLHANRSPIVLNGALGGIWRALDTMEDTWAQSLAVAEKLMATAEERARPEDWTAQGWTLKDQILQAITRVKEAQLFEPLRRREGLVEPGCKVGFLGRGEDGAPTLIVAWEREGERVVYTALADGFVSLEEDDVQALTPFEEDAMPDEIATYLKDLHSLAGAYFAEYQLDYFEPASDDLPAKAQGIRFIPSPRTRLQYPDDF